ncbi:hypothetical protein QAD02_008211 [Eretmocerus hayati]|uniref:Uncharacterized protein n=1 Tax=Eretmocerus hayati TaxID=131215 RepID=A0ACC2N5T7_9HYME|nr:hypothetical protein QAD02_008211 [Eretmocerus hayati]
MGGWSIPPFMPPFLPPHVTSTASIREVRDSESERDQRTTAGRSNDSSGDDAEYIRINVTGCRTCVAARPPTRCLLTRKLHLSPRRRCSSGDRCSDDQRYQSRQHFNTLAFRNSAIDHTSTTSGTMGLSVGISALPVLANARGVGDA